jgi:ribosomal protein S18 acetylase RimI-like enzyme
MASSDAELLSFSMHPVLSVQNEPFFPALHSMINAAFDVAGYVPPSWEPGPDPKVFKRLGTDPSKGAVILAEELGEFGFVAVAFAGSKMDKVPVASMGVFPFMGCMPRQKVSKPGAEWEITCVAVAPEWRGHALVTKLVAEIVQHLLQEGYSNNRRIRILAMTIEELNGAYWRKIGWTTLEENGWINIPRSVVINRIPGVHIPTSDPILVWYGERWFEEHN